MSEVRPIPSGGWGVFATQAYHIGDVILEEVAPILRLAPVSEDDHRALLDVLPPIHNNNKPTRGGREGTNDDGSGDPISFTQSITPPSSIPKEYIGKFKAMIQAVACFTEIDLKTTPLQSTSLCKTLGLYSPNPDAPSAEEDTIVKVAKAGVKYIQNHSRGESKLRHFVTEFADQALRLMLVWSCNSFEGGRIYLNQSRVNHSCNPNSILQANGDSQVIRASTPIISGDEITLSYLGLLLYTDRPTRRTVLRQTKHFLCVCPRCSSGGSSNDDDAEASAPDPAAAIPCSTCHPRVMNGRYLDEDVAYDDDHQVNYMYPRNSADDYECLVCHTMISHKESHLSPATTAGSSTTTTTTTDPISDVQIVSQKVLVYLQHRQTPSRVVENQTDENINATVEEEDEDEEWEEQLYQLACSVAGTLHWTTNIILLMRLNRMLKRQHRTMIETGETPESEEIAESIDMTERQCRFLQGLGLHLHIGHVLSNVIIGVARTLVSLGDEKSKTYAAEWVTKIKDYSDVFDSDGMKKVVKSLLEVGRKSDSDDFESRAKKAKTK